MKKHYIIPIFVPHKGCPHDCIFCNQKRITGRQDVVDDVFVKNEINKYLSTIPEVERFVEVSFFGGSFTGLPVDEQIKLLTPAKHALDSGRIDAIRLSTRPDYIDENILEVLKKYGVSIIELGVQSMDDEVLLKSNRGHTVEDVYKASRLIKEKNFILGLQMMVGLPGDSESKDLKTAEEFVKIGPDMVRIYPALVIRDTYMELMYNKGEYAPLCIDDCIEICSRIYLMFEKNNINIIRIGLQATENIREGKDIIAGPFHPAFRELVESRILNDVIMHLYSRCKANTVTIYVSERTISKIYAGKKKYYKKTLDKIGPENIRVTLNNELPFNCVMLQCGENSLTMSIKDYSLIN